MLFSCYLSPEKYATANKINSHKHNEMKITKK